MAAYNRSSGMNLVVLASLVTEPAANGKAEPLADLDPPYWPPLLALLAQADIASETWAMVRGGKCIWGGRRQREGCHAVATLGPLACAVGLAAHGFYAAT